MTADLEPAASALTDKQRATLIAKVQADPYCGLVAAARQAGVEGSRGQIRRLLDTDQDFQDALQEARGHLINSVASLKVNHLLAKLGTVVDDDGHASQLRAIQYALGLRGIQVVERIEHEHSGGMEVTNPDVAAAIDRFTVTLRRLTERAQSSGTVRAAAGDGTELPPGEASG